MTSVLDSSVKIAGYIAECKDMGIAVLPPDVNRSEDVFTVEGDSIRFGMAAVKNIGRGLIRRLVEERTANGGFISLEDLCRRMNDSDLNKRAVENLIKCGAMDCFGCKRSQLLYTYETVMDTISDTGRRNVAGQLGMFDLLDDESAKQSVPMPDVPELDRRELMAMEKETTGLYLSGHPMDEYRALLKHANVVPISDVVGDDARYGDEQNVSVAGVVQTVRMKTTRNNSTMAYVTLEDDTASVELIVFSNAINRYGGYLRENEAIVITGRVSIREEKEAQIILNTASAISEVTQFAPAENPQSVSVKKLYLQLPSEDSLEYLKTRAILNMFPGATPVVLYFKDTKIKRGTNCDVQKDMLDELCRLLGAENVVPK